MDFERLSIPVTLVDDTVQVHAQDYVDVSVPVDKSDTSRKGALTHNSNTRRRVASNHVGKGLEYSILATAHWLRQLIPTWGYQDELQD